MTSKASGPNCLEIPLGVSQNSALETPTAIIALADGTNSCAFLSLIFSHLLWEKSGQISPGDEMAALAEEVIETYPTRFNRHRDLGSHYDVSEAYQILNDARIVRAALEFKELLLLQNAVFSFEGRQDLMEAVRQIHDAEKTRVGLYTCGGYIFTIGCKSGNFFLTDTHCISEELGGNGNGLVEVFLDGESSLWHICDWILRRLKVSGVKGESPQSLLEVVFQRWASSDFKIYIISKILQFCKRFLSALIDKTQCNRRNVKF